jgi:propanol-preferring alcohol dehydrogenase
MRAMVINRICSLRDNPEPLQLIDLPKPVPRDDELLVRVAVCGVCHTELDELEGRAEPAFLPIVPGHQVIGYVESVGNRVTVHKAGDRVGVGWIFQSCGGDRENISAAFTATGRDVNGGYAEYMTIPEGYAYPVPEAFSDEQAAPLLCAGSVGYRALKLTGIENGQRLGLTGFGGSGHIVLQLAQHLYPDSEIFVFARSPVERKFATDLGAHWSGEINAAPPAALQAIIDTTPAWDPVLASLANLLPGGRLVINAIRKEAEDRHKLAELSYQDHLWMEKEVKTVANVTACDIRELLAIAAEVPILPRTRTYPLQAANKALTDIRQGDLRGSIVLKVLN